MKALEESGDGQTSLGTSGLTFPPEGVQEKAVTDSRIVLRLSPKCFNECFGDTPEGN